MKHTLFALLLASVLSVPVHAQAPSTYKYSGYVNDYANAIDASSEAKLSDELKALDTNKGVQLAVVTVPSLDNLEPSEFAQELFSNWGIGHKGDNTGVLYLICPSEHKQRIHTGYGVESVLSDIVTVRILKDTEPKMSREGSLSPAITARAEAVIETVKSSNDLGFDAKDVAAKDRARNTYATSPDTSVPVEENKSDGTIGNILAGIVLFVLGVMFIMWIIIGRKQRQQEKELLYDTVRKQAKQMLDIAVKSELKYTSIMNTSGVTAPLVLESNEVNKKIKSNHAAVLSAYANYEKQSVKDLSNANTGVRLFIQDSEVYLSKYERIANDINVLDSARRLNFDFEDLRNQTMRSTSDRQSSVDLVNSKYPSSVWGDFDYVSYETKLASYFNEMNAIKNNSSDIISRNFTIDTAKNVEASHKKFKTLKARITEIQRTISNKLRECEQAEEAIKGNELGTAYTTAKRNVEQQFVKDETKTRLADAQKAYTKFLNELKYEKDVLKLASQQESLLSTFNLIAERAKYDVRKYHQDIADAAAAAAAAIVAARRRVEREKEEKIEAERRRKQREQDDRDEAERRRKRREQDDRDEEERRRNSSSSSYGSSSSYDSSSSSDSFSFGGGDSGGGGSDSSW